MAEAYLGKVDAVLGIESRGFIFGAPVAYRLGVGLAIARKPGKLPYNFVEESYELEYGHAELQMHEDGVVRDARVLIVDDLLATGGTAHAAMRLVQQNRRRSHRMRLRGRAERAQGPRAPRAGAGHLAHPV